MHCKYRKQKQCKSKANKVVEDASSRTAKQSETSFGQSKSVQSVSTRSCEELEIHPAPDIN